jgi:septum formation protein
MNCRLVLGSKSPRRHELIKALGLPVEIRLQDVEEIYPNTLPQKDVPEYLAKLKALPLLEGLKSNEVLSCSDTIVLLNDTILGTPKNVEEAMYFLNCLSGNTHYVITGVFMANAQLQKSFSHTTEVVFNPLSKEDIERYVFECKPFDKAGAYAIQEWIGQVGIKEIKGSYCNVVGLPLADIKEKLTLFY